MINFNKKTVASTIMDPRKGFDRNSINTEIRIDPLTGESGRLAHFGMIKIQKMISLPGIPRIPEKTVLFAPQILKPLHLGSLRRYCRKVFYKKVKQGSYRISPLMINTAH